MPWIESLPVTIVLIAMVFIMLLACEAGYHLGQRGRTDYDREVRPSLGSIVSGLLAMLALVLAFTLPIASGHCDLRKLRAMEDTNALRTACLRADVIQA